MSNSTIPRATRGNSQPPASTEALPSTAPYDPRAALLRSDKITDEHLQRSAIVYVRQSTQQQVLEHSESTARQYALTNRAVMLGCWSRSSSNGCCKRSDVQAVVQLRRTR